MQYRTDGATTYLRIDKDARVFEAISTFCAEHGIAGGHFQGIGACSEVTVATWIPELGDYKNHEYKGMIEMVSLMGNVSRNRDGSPRLHAHASFSMLNEADQPVVFAGHVREVTIGYTAELALTPAARPIDITFDERAGIDVWNLEA